VTVFSVNGEVWVPWFSHSGNGVGENDKLSGDGYEGQLAGLPFVDEPRVESFVHGVAANSRDCGHVECRSHTCPAATDMIAALRGATALGMRSEAGQACHSMTV
jgi:hypothetical protein